MFILCNAKLTPVRACFFFMIWRPEVVPPVTQEVKGRKQNHFGFWNIPSRPTSVASFIEIGQPKFPTSGTLSQIMTLKNCNTRNTKILTMLFQTEVLIKFDSLSGFKLQTVTAFLYSPRRLLFSLDTPEIVEG